MARQRAKITVHILGEGETEVAFLKYLRSIFVVRNCGVTVKIENARGKGADYVICKAIKKTANYDYCIKATLLDNDVGIKPSSLKKAKRSKLSIIESSPCLEGLFLKILGKRVPNNCRDCKRQFKELHTIDLNNPSNFSRIFPRNIVEEKRQVVEELERLCCLMEGKPQ